MTIATGSDTPSKEDLDIPGEVDVAIGELARHRITAAGLTIAEAAEHAGLEVDHLEELLAGRAVWFVHQVLHFSHAVDEAGPHSDGVTDPGQRFFMEVGRYLESSRAHDPEPIE